MYYVYALESVLKKRIYIGQTKDLDRRLRYHNNGLVKSTSKDKPWKLIAFQEAESMSEARRHRRMRAAEGSAVQ